MWLIEASSTRFESN